MPNHCCGPGRLAARIVTEADLLDKAAHGRELPRRLALLSDLLANRDPSWRVKAAGQAAGDLMTRRVITVEPADDVHTAALRMIEGRVTRRPVVDDGRVVGVIARHDV